MFVAGVEDEILRLLLGPLGTLVLALVIIFTGVRKVWVFGWQYKELHAEKNEWKDAALRGTHIAERVVTVHEAQEKRVGEGNSGG